MSLTSYACKIPGSQFLYPLQAIMSSADACSSAVVAHSPPQLYSDVLESIFAFLSIRDLSVVTRLSRNWLAASQSMRSIQFDVSGEEACELKCMPAILQSRLARHIGTVGRFHHMSQSFEISPAAFALPLARVLSNLIHFTALSQMLWQSMRIRIRFP